MITLILAITMFLVSLYSCKIWYRNGYRNGRQSIRQEFLNDTGMTIKEYMYYYHNPMPNNLRPTPIDPIPSGLSIYREE